MENPEEILHHLEEFSKLRPKSIPRELEEYLCFVAKTGDPVYQWSVIKCLFREKLISVITEFYESCPSVEIPPCPNVDLFNYDTMKSFILEKLDTFVAAPFTVQRICELLTTPRKEYNRIDKYMRALEKNILVVSTTEPDHVQDGTHDINIEEMDDAPAWPPKSEDSYQSTSKDAVQAASLQSMYTDTAAGNESIEPDATSSTQPMLETVICCAPEISTIVPEKHVEQAASVTEEKAGGDLPQMKDETAESVPAVVQRRRNSIEPPSEQSEDTPETTTAPEEAITYATTEVKIEEIKPDLQPEVLLEQPVDDVVAPIILPETKFDVPNEEEAVTTSEDMIETKPSAEDTIVSDQNDEHEAQILVKKDEATNEIDVINLPDAEVLPSIITHEPPVVSYEATSTNQEQPSETTAVNVPTESVPDSIQTLETEQMIADQLPTNSTEDLLPDTSGTPIESIPTSTTDSTDTVSELATPVPTSSDDVVSSVKEELVVSSECPDEAIAAVPNVMQEEPSITMTETPMEVDSNTEPETATTEEMPADSVNVD